MNETQLTKSGVAYDLSVSPHKLEVKYSDEILTFTFSSKLYKDKFNEKMISHRDKVNQSLSKRFGFEITNDKLCDIKLYTMIEKRGFLLDNTEERFEWLNNIKLDGHNLIKMN